MKVKGLKAIWVADGIYFQDKDQIWGTTVLVVGAVDIVCQSLGLELKARMKEFEVEIPNCMTQATNY
jgi:hypothetical protein